MMGQGLGTAPEHMTWAPVGWQAARARAHDSPVELAAVAFFQNSPKRCSRGEPALSRELFSLLLAPLVSNQPRVSKEGVTHSFDIVHEAAVTKETLQDAKKRT